MKQSRRLALALLPVLCLVLSLAGCRDDAAAWTPEYYLAPETSEQTGEPSAGASAPAGAVQSLTYEMTPENSFDILEGKWLVTLTGARAVTRIQDLPEGGFDRVSVALFNEDGTYDYYGNDPGRKRSGSNDGVEHDFLQEDGTFVDGIYMILLDITVESSQDAVLRTMDKKGSYYDPDTYGAQHLFELRDLNVDLSLVPLYEMCFYSDFGTYVNEEDRARHPDYNEGNYNMAIRVPPGETKSITVGFVLGNYPDGTPRNLENLYAIHEFVGKKSAIKLGLTNP